MSVLATGSLPAGNIRVEQGEALWIARGTPRAWLKQGQQIVVKNAPTHFGVMGYEKEIVELHGLTGTVNVLATYR